MYVILVGMLFFGGLLMEIRYTIPEMFLLSNALMCSKDEDHMK